MTYNSKYNELRTRAVEGIRIDWASEYMSQRDAHSVLSLLEENNILRAALEFYADEDSYGCDCSSCLRESNCQCDRGVLAREALNK